MASTNANGNFYCNVCKINLNNEGSFALHAFNDKHCENLIKLAKNKPVKAKTAKVLQPPPPTPPPPPAPSLQPEGPSHYEEIPKVNPSLYGYFDPQMFYTKEFNTEYDPYLQKLAENPYKPPPPPPPPPAPVAITTNFASGKKKKVRFCELCEITLNTVPQFEAHMKSGTHIYKLKMLGMGVSAHFVKASTDLHTTDTVNANAASDSTDKKTGTIENLSPEELYCSVCKLQLNSRSQLEAHMTGKSHTDKIKKKKNQDGFITCYTCNVQLAGICVFNDHKAGRKHRNKCVNLLRNGYTIPPEERPKDMVNKKFQNPPRYPELYVEQVLEKHKTETEPEPEAKSEPEPIPLQTATPEKLMPPPMPPPPKPPLNLATGMYHCTKCPRKFTTVSNILLHMLSVHPKPKVNTIPATPVVKAVPMEQEPVQIEEEVLLKCTICDESLPDTRQFQTHFQTESHALKAWRLKLDGMSAAQIVAKMADDFKQIKPCSNRFTCLICDVVSNNLQENKLHFESMVHKVAEKTYFRERLIALQESVPTEEDGTFRCKTCEESFANILLFNQHTVNSVHMGIINQDKRRRIIMHSLKMNAKNPGVRTKISGLAVNVDTGSVERVPNLEPLEPKIDDAKNANVGFSMPESVGDEGRRSRASRMQHQRGRFMPYRPPRRNYGPQWPRTPGPPRFYQQIPPGPWCPRERFPPPSHPWQNDDWNSYPNKYF